MSTFQIYKEGRLIGEVVFSDRHAPFVGFAMQYLEISTGGTRFIYAIAAGYLAVLLR
jgi:hypothetical protein